MNQISEVISAVVRLLRRTIFKTPERQLASTIAFVAILLAIHQPLILLGYFMTGGVTIIENAMFLWKKYLRQPSD